MMQGHANGYNVDVGFGEGAPACAMRLRRGDAADGIPLGTHAPASETLAAPVAAAHKHGTKPKEIPFISLLQGWRVWVPILNGDTLRSGHVNTNESRMKSAHALATLNLAFKVVSNRRKHVSPRPCPSPLR